MSQIIENGSVVAMAYTLTNASGEVLDQSKEGSPLLYLHGYGNIIPGLEKELLGLTIGNKKKVEVAPAEGYGEYNEELLFRVPRENFPAEVDIVPGMEFQSRDENGTMIIVVKSLDGDVVEVDANHPLAGATLFFDVTIEEVRPATEQELAHGHVHAGGHDH